MMVLMALSTNASEQTKGTEYTGKSIPSTPLLGNAPCCIKFRASDMVFNIHSDASYLSEPNACSRACGHFFMGSLPIDGKLITLNGAFHTLCSILRFVVASAAEAELGALFLNCQEGMIFKSTLKDLGHSQPKILVHCDSTIAVGIANNTIKRQRLRAMEMRYFWTYEKMDKMCILLNGTLEWKILWITRANSPWCTSHHDKAVLFTRDKFPPGTSTYNKSKHSERLCWNPKGRVCT